MVVSQLEPLCDKQSADYKSAKYTYFPSCILDIYILKIHIFCVFGAVGQDAINEKTEVLIMKAFKLASVQSLTYAPADRIY